MSEWLEPVSAALDRRRTPLDVFFRDDDGGWDDAAVLRLVDAFADVRVPLDLAVIPAALSPALAAELRDRLGANLGVHQHGWQHTNHEFAGRKCEFGPSRTAAVQYADIRAGRDLLAQRFGASVDAIFTPPWNRCTTETAEALGRLGFAALSRSAAATPIACPSGLAELPVAVDWQKWRADDAPDRAAIAREFVAAIEARAHEPLGIMLHHAPMRDRDFAALRELTALLATHAAVRCRAMRDLLPVRPVQERAA